MLRLMLHSFMGGRISHFMTFCGGGNLCLTRADKELGEAQSLEDEIERNKCFNWRLSWGWRYCLSIKVAKKTLCISQLLENSNFERVGYRSTLPGLEFIPSKDFMSSESSNSAFKGIMEALNNGDVNMIGLYGMGGVGKTTLAKEVGNQAKQLFDKVVVVTVSQNPNINNIQDKIADFLDLDFQKKTPEGRAEQLWLRIKDEKSILIILDDVWEELDLKVIGIPFGDDHKGCKIFLTTRLQQVCTRMNSQKEVHLNILSENEAWALFKDKAGVEDDSPTLIVAKEVARECNGLPLAIVTVAKALKGKSLNGWMVANQRLRDSRPLDNQDVYGGIYSRLELSYDYLEDDNVKSCFLLCSLFPEDFEIPIEILVMCGIGQGLFCNINSFEVLRREIYEALTKLQQSGLLLETDDEETIKMHDVVRDFAHWVTLRGENKFMVKDGLTEWSISESFGYYTAISLWDVEINNFPDNLEFSKLKTFFLVGDTSLEISSMFFEGMKTLRVLLLKNVVLSLKALQFLTNLRTLCFVDCKLRNISSLGNMENLEILTLFVTNIEELTEELVELRRLKSLYFHGEEHCCYFPPNLLSRLRVSTDQCSQENFVFPKLQRYDIAVNEDTEDLMGMHLRTLTIRDFSSSLNAFKELFCNVENLTLHNITMESLIDTKREQSSTTAFSTLVNLKMKGMTSLKKLCRGQSPISFLQKLETLSISDCKELQSVFQMNGKESQMQSISNLRNLELRSLPTLESLWKEPTHHDVGLHGVKEFLYNAKNVTLERVMYQKNLIPNVDPKGLNELTFLALKNGKELECLIDATEGHVSNDALINLVELVIEEMTGLKMLCNGLIPKGFLQKLEKLTARNCMEIVSLSPTPQSLKFVEISYCHRLKHLFSPSLAQSLVLLQQLMIDHCDGLQHIITELGRADEIKPNAFSPFLPKLETLRISYCPRLEYVFQIPLAQVLPRLKSFWITDSPQLQQVFIVAKENNGVYCAIELPCLQDLRLVNLTNLGWFCSENFLISSSSLEELEV
ncbi:PREDICTED: probable disease resistance protein At1g61300 [Theobroma cacao]|uniref:Probable disease resistance protein At1g61300 n=1 Tax=Theobroma cacao TaxID=3641 RepID=A0AB32WQ67_THECC|nr:PREDICTED: probable disease resistance protein At1g61300 [Theobroma cacao]